MKIQLDTNAKIIRIDEMVNLGQFIDELEMILPGGKWKEYHLQALITNWVQPYVIQPIYNPARPWHEPYPWWTEPWIICDGSTQSIEMKSYDLNAGTYNIQINDWPD
jgi:hypothetical protein